MNVIGIDIGTTTICVIVFNILSGEQIQKIIVPNQFIKTDHSWEKIQNPAQILSEIEGILNRLTEKYTDIVSIGITGQMHGILYVDESGRSVSPLYTWQDRRADFLTIQGKSLEKFSESKLGYGLTSGYGFATHMYNQVNGLVPDRAIKIKTIEDFVADALVRENNSMTHATNAAALGLYDIEKNTFDERALEKLSIDQKFLPEIESDVIVVGEYKGIPVTISVGDNQAGFAGAIKQQDSTVFINVGTSAQVSFISEKAVKISKSIDVRPYLDGKYLLVGSSLCGGCAYKLLENFFRTYVEAAGYKEEKEQYEVMDNIIRSMEPAQDVLQVSTLFAGTRDNIALRGTISNISLDNFTPGNLIYGFIEGIVRELFDMYKTMLPYSVFVPSVVAISGNAIRKSKVMQEMTEKLFSLPLKVAKFEEEAAVGAALISAVYTGNLDSWDQAHGLIRYQ